MLYDLYLYFTEGFCVLDHLYEALLGGGWQALVQRHLQVHAPLLPDFVHQLGRDVRQLDSDFFISDWLYLLKYTTRHGEKKDKTVWDNVTHIMVHILLIYHLEPAQNQNTQTGTTLRTKDGHFWINDNSISRRFQSRL